MIMNQQELNKHFRTPTKTEINKFACKIQEVYKKYKKKVLIQDVIEQINNLKDDCTIVINKEEDIGFRLKNTLSRYIIFISPNFIEGFLADPSKFELHYFIDLLKIFVYFSNNPLTLTSICPGYAARPIKKSIQSCDLQMLIITIFNMNSLNPHDKRDITNYPDHTYIYDIHF